MDEPVLSLAACGVDCVHGTGAEAALQAIAAQAKAPLRRLDNFFNSGFEKQIVALPPQRRPAPMRMRLPELLQFALHDLQGRLHGQGLTLPRPLSCTLLLAEAGYPGAASPEVRAALVAQIEAFLGAPQQIRIIEKGAAGIGLWAETSLTSGGAHLLLAVDSLCTIEALQELDDSGLLFSRRSPHGLVPGEAAMAALFLPGASQGQIELRKAAVATEPVIEFEEKDTDFAAMSDAAGRCLDRSPDLWIADTNNSRYRAAQLAHAVLRVGGGAPVCALPLFFGDCGSVNGCLAMLVAQQPDKTGTRAMITTSNRSGLCAAVLVGQTDEEAIAARQDRA